MPTGTSPVVRQAATATRNGAGESYTHGQWNEAVADIAHRLATLPQALDTMLGSLHAADAGRSQVAGVVALAEQTHGWAQQVKAMLAEVNRRELPVVEAVDAAGGPPEIASIPYLSEV